MVRRDKRWAMSDSKKYSLGFFSVELLVVLFIAAAFVISGYQLYTSVLDASLYGKSDIEASNLANDYMERFRYRASTPCNEKTVIDAMPISGTKLQDPKVTVKVTCPTQGVTSFLKNGVSSKIESEVTYNGGRKTSTNKIVNNKVTIKQISSKYHFSVALGDDGRVYTWGNLFSNVGDGTTAPQSYALRPVSVISDTGALQGKRIVKVAAGGYHSLALDSEGEVYAWGNNSYGRLGAGHSSTTTTVQKVYTGGTSSLAGKKVIDIAANFGTSAALDSLGNVHTWGYGELGQLGNGTAMNSNVPVQITGISAKAISGGNNHFLALSTSGQVYGWGAKDYYVLGDGSNTGSSLTPTLIPGLSSVSQISAGLFHNFALTSNNKLYAWGSGAFGKIGDGTTTNRTTPIDVSATSGFLSSPLAGKTIKSIDAGGESSFAIDSEGILYGWGSNTYGQLGIAPMGTSSDNYKPRKVVSGALLGRNISSVALGRYHTLAVDTEGDVYSWGYNTDGQLGNGTSGAATTTVVPAMVQNGVVISKLSTGYYHTIALMSDGKMFAWGYGSSGQMGNGSTANRTFPIEIDTTGTPMAGKTIVDVVSGAYHNLALDSTGAVYAWGLGTSGQIGDGAKTNRSRPVLVDMTDTPLAGKTITQLAASEFNSMALTDEGKVYVWGRGTNGVLGNGTIVDMANPRPVEVDTTGTPMAGKTITQITLGALTNAYALDSSGQVYSWGCIFNGALGDGVSSNTTTTSVCTSGTATKPVTVAVTGTPMDGQVITDISAGYRYVLARTAYGDVYAWGLNSSGQLGDGTTSSRDRPIAVNVPPLQKIMTKYTSSAGVTEGGAMYSWGANTYYQQTNGTQDLVSTPTMRAPFTARAVDQVSLGAYTMIVMDYGQNLYGWGRNNYGSLGIANIDEAQQTSRPLTSIRYDNTW